MRLHRFYYSSTLMVFSHWRGIMTLNLTIQIKQIYLYSTYQIKFLICSKISFFSWALEIEAANECIFSNLSQAHSRKISYYLIIYLNFFHFIILFWAYWQFENEKLYSFRNFIMNWNWLFYVGNGCFSYLRVYWMRFMYYDWTGLLESILSDCCVECLPLWPA